MTSAQVGMKTIVLLIAKQYLRQPNVPNFQLYVWHYLLLQLKTY
jgi:ABC-type cobalamin transport system ATPase subunit